jgi:hypothetical protein
MKKVILALFCVLPSLGMLNACSNDDEISTIEKSRNYLVGKCQLVKYGVQDMMNDSTFFHFTEDGKLIQYYKIGQQGNLSREYSYLVVDAWISSENSNILKGYLLCKGWQHTDTLSFSLNNDNLVLAPKEDPGVKYVMDPNIYFEKVNY